MKLKHTKLQIILEIITILILIAMVVNLKVSWGNIADDIPTHYNAAGEVDKWGHKVDLFFVPIICSVLYILLTAITFFPALWNVPVSVNEENKTRVYASMKNMMCLLKLEMVINFAYISYKSSKAQVLAPYFFYVTLAVIFGTIIFFIARTYVIAKKKS